MPQYEHCRDCSHNTYYSATDNSYCHEPKLMKGELYRGLFSQRTIDDKHVLLCKLNGYKRVHFEEDV